MSGPLKTARHDNTASRQHALCTDTPLSKSTSSWLEHGRLCQGVKSIHSITCRPPPAEALAHQSALRGLHPLCHLCHDLLMLLLGQALERQVAGLRQLPLQQHLLLLPRLQVGALLLGKGQQRPLLLSRGVRSSLHSRGSVHWLP